MKYQEYVLLGATMGPNNNGGPPNSPVDTFRMEYIRTKVGLLNELRAVINIEGLDQPIGHDTSPDTQAYILRLDYTDMQP